MGLKDIVLHRRAIRKYDSNKSLDTEKVKECIALAQLAPTSSNMQLWEAYHVINKEVLSKLSKACLDQTTASTAQQMVVFVTRRDLHREREKEVLAMTIDNIEKTSPKDRQAHRIKLQSDYYKKVMPLLYSNCFGLLGLFRKFLSHIIGLFRPIVRQTSENDIRVVVHKSCALVVETFMLAMSEQGYDTCPIEGFDSLLVKKALGLPYSVEINMIISCGVRMPQGVWGERVRIDFEKQYKLVE